MRTQDPSYVMRVDKKTGKTMWRVLRPTDAIHESPDAYTTPTLLRYAATRRSLSWRRLRDGIRSRDRRGAVARHGIKSGQGPLITG